MFKSTTDSVRLALLASATALAFGAFGFANPAKADTVLFDRGLPTTNLNNAAGSDRSNVAWGEQGPDAAPAVNSIGEDYTLSGNAVVNSVTVWVIDNGTSGGTPAANSYQLWIGSDTNPGIGSTASVSQVATSATVTQVTYAGGASYQSSSGSYDNIYQVTFTGLGLSQAAGTYAFAVSGLSDSGMLTPFLSASNAALGGANQVAGTGDIYGFDAAGNMDTTNGYPWADIAGWDKSSDIDIVVSGVAVPEPVSLTLFGAALAGLGVVRRKKARA